MQLIWVERPDWRPEAALLAAKDGCLHSGGRPGQGSTCRFTVLVEASVQPIAA